MTRLLLVAALLELPAVGTPPPTSFSVRALPRCERPLIELFSRKQMHLPRADSDGYRPASPAQQQAFEVALGALGANDLPSAQVEAEQLRYTLCRAGGTAVLQPLDGSGRAHVAWRGGDARPIILSVPHPIADVGTLAQGIELFRRLRARALIVGGSHRCASLTLAGCPGWTSICTVGKELEPYRASDVAHNHESLFHIAHEIIADVHPDAYMVSLHGTWRRTPIISDGTKRPLPDDAFAARVARHLSFQVDDVRSCNQLEGVPPTQSLCGTTNVQGRALYGLDTCHGETPDVDGRFVHVEQPGSMRQPGSKALRKALLGALREAGAEEEALLARARRRNRRKAPSGTPGRPLLASPPLSP